MTRKALFGVVATLVCVSFLLVPSAEGAKVLVEKPAVQPPPGQPVAYQPVDTEALAGLGATILAEYPFFYLADVPAASLAQFLNTAQARGFAVTAKGNFDQIRVNGYVFPSVGALPSLPPQLTLAAYPNPIGLYLVQMVGPNRAEWERALQAIGTPILYYADNTYVVRANPKLLANLRALPFLQHVSVYQPAYKLRADVLAAEGPVPVVVQLDGGQDLTSVFAILKALTGNELDTRAPGLVANIAVEITPDDAITLASLPEVLWIERVLPAAPSDERQALPLAGYSNADGTQPTNPTLYDDWLLARGFCTPSYRPAGCLDYGDLSIANNSAVVVYDTGLDINVCLAEGTDCSGGTKIRHPDLDPREARFFCADSGSTNYCQSGSQFVYSDDCGHGTAVASVITGDPISGVEALQLPGVSALDGQNYYLGSGIAPLAKIASFKIFAWNQGACSSLTALTAADFQRWGARIVASYGNQAARFANHSWNFGEEYTYYNTVSQMFDRLVRDADGNADHFDRPSTIVFSAGNRQDSNWSPNVTAPANAKNVITVGMAESWRTSDVDPWLYAGYPSSATSCQRGDANSIKNISLWSRRGSAPDSGYGTRFKPDLVAGGTRVGAAYSRALVSQSVTCEPSRSGDPNGRYYTRELGTSFAAPVVTGAAVLADAWYRNKTGVIPSPAMLKSVLVAHATDLFGGQDMMYGAPLPHRPSAPQGWGRVNLEQLFATNGVGVQFLDEDHDLTPVRRFLPGSASWSTTVSFTPPNPDIVVVMAFTDAAATPGAGPLDVNNLDLVARNGFYKYYGNTFDSAGYTPRTFLGLAGDVANTVEMVRIRAGELAGSSFTVEVRPAAISAKAVPGLDGSSSNQDFALYVYFAR